MMGTLPSHQQSALFSYYVSLERRISSEHLLRKVDAALDLSFVLPAVRRFYGRSGNVSLDPRTIVKMLLLLFLYDIRSERELMEQIAVRMDFLWFLGMDLETPVPNHSVLSKARTRWGGKVFEKLFAQTVEQCVKAGLVDGRLLHVDSTMVKANAARDSVICSGPELVSALRQAYQQQEAKLQIVNETQGTERPARPAGPEVETPTQEGQPQSGVEQTPQLAACKLPVNSTHISVTDPEAELARSKNGVTELNYKDHRLVDDANGVITAVAATTANVADGHQLPDLYEQHVERTGLLQAGVAIAGDHHYGTAENFIYCAQQEVRAHLGVVSANVQERGKLPVEQFEYEADKDRLRCPQGHYLVLHQNRPEEQSKVYLIEDPARCAACPLREQCTSAKRGRSVRRHVQADFLARARARANSPEARYHRKRRQHVIEGSFADAMNNHGAKRARWRGLWRQQIQSWMIAAVQNLRILLNCQRRCRPFGAADVVVNWSDALQTKVLSCSVRLNARFSSKTWLMRWSEAGEQPAH